MMNKKNGRKHKVTVTLDRETIRQAKLIAPRRSTSLSELVARRIELMFGAEGSNEESERQARKLLEWGFHLGGGVRVERDELHRRKSGGVGPI
jgi:hypothetical protein